MTKSFNIRMLAVVLIAGIMCAGSVSANKQQQTEQIIKKLVEVNRYWLIGPSPEVHNYSYKFKLVTSPEPVTYDVKNPSTTSQSIRQGIGYYSLLNYVALHPENIKITDFAEKDSTIQLTVSIAQEVIMSCGNGIEKEKGFRGSFSVPMMKGTIWIDPNRMVPLKADIGNVNEEYGDYVSAEPNHWVPRNIKIDNNIMHFDLRFNFFKPGLWLFDTSEYRIDETEHSKAKEYHGAASISNVKINGAPAISQKETTKQMQF